MDASTSVGIDHVDGDSVGSLRNSVYRMPWAGLLLTGIGIGVASFFIIGRQYQRAEESVSRVATETGSSDALGLLVEARGTELLLSWSPGAAPIMKATQGMLSIQTDDFIQSIVLTQDQLRSGRMVYSPKTGTDRIDIRLQVNGPDQPVMEHAILMLPAAGALPDRIAENAAPVQNLSPDESSATRYSDSKLRLWSRHSVVVLAREASAAAEFKKHPSSLAKLTRTGALFTVPRGTAITPRETEAGFLRVRIIEGAHLGQEGWIQASQARRKDTHPKAAHVTRSGA